MTTLSFHSFNQKSLQMLSLNSYGINLKVPLILPNATHCVKSVRIWSFSGLYFPSFELNTERYCLSFHIQSIQRMQENTGHKNYWHFLCSDSVLCLTQMFHFSVGIAALKIKTLLLLVNWSLRPWPRPLRYLLWWSQDYCFDLACLL